jgi:DNA relaxase NicK
VVDASGEVDLGRLKGVVGREVDGEEEDTARVWGLALFEWLAMCRKVSRVDVFVDGIVGVFGGARQAFDPCDEQRVKRVNLRVP